MFNSRKKKETKMLQGRVVGRLSDADFRSFDPKIQARRWIFGALIIAGILALLIVKAVW
jgi:hypothetical protein